MSDWKKGDTVWAARLGYGDPPCVMTGSATVQSAGTTEIRIAASSNGAWSAFGFRQWFGVGDGRLHRTEREAVEALQRDVDTALANAQATATAVADWLKMAALPSSQREAP